jgi:hypothetical protein
LLALALQVLQVLALQVLQEWPFSPGMGRLQQRLQRPKTTELF